MSDLALSDVSYVEANWGRWVARCPRPWCTNALQVSLGAEVMTCAGLGGCGAHVELVWPADPEAITLLLSMRPVERTRNWLPGETLADLMCENAAHGLIPPEWEQLADASGGSLPLLETRDGRLTGGLLLAELDAARRREIGA